MRPSAVHSSPVAIFRVRMWCMRHLSPIRPALQYQPLSSSNRWFNGSNSNRRRKRKSVSSVIGTHGRFLGASMTHVVSWDIFGYVWKKVHSKLHLCCCHGRGLARLPARSKPLGVARRS